MKKIIMAFLSSVFTTVAFGAGYYEQRVVNCDPAAMQREMDAATARTGAGITVVRCDAGVAQRPAPVVHRVEYVDFDCDCF